MGGVPSSRTIGNLLDEQVRRFPERDAVVHEGKKHSYGELKENSDRLSKALLTLGIAKGSRIGLLMLNRIEWIETYLALTKIGAIVVALNTFSKAQQLRTFLRHSDLDTLIMQDRYARSGKISNDYIATLHELCPGLAERLPGDLLSEAFPFLRRVIVLGGEKYPGTLDFGDVVELGEGVSDLHLRNAQAEVKPRDPALIIYTSGSTGTPKGVILAHYGLIESGINFAAKQHATENDRLYFSAPLFWVYGVGCALNVSLTAGACLVLQSRFEPAEALRLLEAEKCTLIYGTDNMFTELLNHPDRSRTNLSTLRSGICSAIRRAALLGAPWVCTSYGMTETYCFSALSDAYEPLERRATTQGRALPGNTLVIVDPGSGEPVPFGKSGEIRVKGLVMKGYYKDEDRNAGVYDERGFFKTGDIGWMEEDGTLHFQGRLDDVIKTGGINVSPVELEDFLVSHPKIMSAFVVPVPDKVRGKGQLVCAVLVLRNEADPCSAEEIQKYCKEKLGAHMKPEYVIFRKTLPVTGTKVDKVALADEVARELGIK